jgi:hypothetical protein
MRSIEDVRSYLRRRVVVLYSGAPAQTLKTAGPSLEVDINEAVRIIQTPGRGAEQDWAKARELFHPLRSIEHPDTDSANEDAVQVQLNAIEGALWEEAVNLVRTHAAIIKSVAQKFVERISKPGETLVLQPSDLAGC